MKIELTGVAIGAPNRCFGTEGCPQHAVMAIRINNVPVYTCALCFKTKIESGEWEIALPKSSKMTIVTLLEQVGLENVQVQPLASSMCDIKSLKKGGTKITFITDQQTPTDFMMKTGKVGLILWLPHDKLPHG